MSQRILIVDDNAIFRKALRQVLEAEDHWEIVEAIDGREAIAKAVETRPNWIVLDLAMPGKDGLATAREISKILPDTPILMCTMHMSSYLETEAQRSGIRKVLSKTDGNLLLSAIRELLKQEMTANQAPVPETISPPVIATSPALNTPPTEAVADPPPSFPKNLA